MTVDRHTARRLLLVGLMLAGILVTALLTSPDGQSGPPLDPRSTSSLGTRALVDTLAALGTNVSVTDQIPSSEVPVVLLLADVLDERQRDGLRAWVNAGGRLVVTDPLSAFSPEAAGSTEIGFIDASISRRCDLPLLGDVERVAAPSGRVYEPDPDAGSCFPRNGGAWLVTRQVGEGAVIALGGATAFVNAHLDEADNALLAVALLAPDGEGQLALLEPPGVGEGDTTLGELVDPRVRVAFVQLAVAFLLVVAWRARRLGAPVPEPVPVRIPGSELVVAVGNLLRQARGRRRSAALLRDDLRRQLAERLGIPVLGEPESVVAAVMARGAEGFDAAAVRSALAGPAPESDEELVALALQLERVRRLVLCEDTHHGD